MNREITPTNPETLRLVPGINVLEIPYLGGKKLESNPDYISEETGWVPGSKEEVIVAMKDFFDLIQSQGGEVLGIVDRQYSSNLPEAEYLDNVQISTMQLAIVRK